MSDSERRRALRAQYRANPPQGGVYVIRNTGNGRALLGATTNLASVRNKLEFARSTETPGALDYRLRDDIRRYGLDAFAFEVLEVLEPDPTSTSQQVRDDLATLEALWREQLDPSLLY